MNLHHAAMMTAPSLTQGYCAICGLHAVEKHHAVPRSVGGKMGPVIHLCGRGNTSGHHGQAHDHTLHLRYTDRWEWLETSVPTKYEAALEMRGWLPCPDHEMADC